MIRITQTVIAALGLAVAGSALARYDDDEMRMRVRDSFFDHARVINVDRIVATEDQPVSREECWKEPKDEYHPGSTYRREIEESVPGSYNDTAVRTEVDQLVASGRSRRDAVDEVAARRGLRRSAVYRIATSTGPRGDQPAG